MREPLEKAAHVAEEWKRGWDERLDQVRGKLGGKRGSAIVVRSKEDSPLPAR